MRCPLYPINGNNFFSEGTFDYISIYLCVAAAFSLTCDYNNKVEFKLKKILFCLNIPMFATEMIQAFVVCI